METYLSTVGHESHSARQLVLRDLCIQTGRLNRESHSYNRKEPTERQGTASDHGTCVLQGVKGNVLV